MSDTYYDGAYTGAEIDAAIAAAMAAAPQSTTYTKTEVDTLLSAKAPQSTTYTKTEVDTLLSAKAPQSTTYTKTEVDTLLSAKAPQSTTYTKTEVDTALSGKQAKLTTAQLAAANSGITSAKVTQYDKDSAALPDAVNRGAKNLFDFKSWASQITSIQNGTYTSTDNSITLTATGNDAFTKPQTGGYHVAVKPNTAYVLSFTGADANGQIVMLENDAFSKFYTLNTSSGSCTLNFTTSGTADRLSVRFGVPTSGNASTISNVMICTKADWDVSNSFVKYAPSNRELYEMILALQS